MTILKYHIALDDRTALKMNQQSKINHKIIFCQTIANDQRLNLRVHINITIIDDLFNTGVDVNIITPESWH